ncbi:MAG: TonB-dependent siderophore receptor [Pseudomonadota bacterium]
MRSDNTKETGFLVRRLMAAASVTVLAALPGHAAAQTALEVEDEERADDAGDLGVTDVIIVRGTNPDRYRALNASSATGVDTSILDTPRSIQVITEQIILDQQSQDLRDVLRNVSGIQTRNISGGTTDAFILRGFEVQNVLQDGFQIDRNSQRVQTANIERIEVVKGPNAILFGQSQPGGVINVITKKPLDEIRNTATGTFDEFGRKEGLLDFTGPLNASNTLLYRFVASVERTQTFRETDTAAQIERDILAPSLTWRPGVDTAITASLEYIASELPVDEGFVALEDENGNLFIPDIDRSVRFGEATDVNETDQITARFSFDHNFNETWFVKADVNYQDSEVVNFSHAPQGALPNGTLFRGQQQFEPEIERFFAAVKTGGKFDALGVENSLVVGADYNERDFFSIGSFGTALDTIDIFNPVYGQSTINVVQATEADTTDQQIGVYGQHVVTVDDWLILSAGLRVDFFERDGEFSFRGNPTSRALESQSELSPNAGVVLKPTEELSLFASYSQSFDPNGPSVNQLTGEAVTVDPSEGEQFEVGVKGSFFDDKAFFNLAYFDITRTNIPFGTDPITGVTLLNGEEQSQGVEFDGNIQFLEGLNVIVNYAYTDAEVTEGARAGNRARNVPRHTANLWATYEFTDGPLRGLGLGGGMNYVGERFVDANNTFMLDGHTLFDATAFYYLPLGFDRSKVRLQVSVRNISDKRYFIPNSNIRTLSVGAPRTVSFGVGFEF